MRSMNYRTNRQEGGRGRGRTVSSRKDKRTFVGGITAAEPQYRLVKNKNQFAPCTWRQFEMMENITETSRN